MEAGKHLTEEGIAHIIRIKEVKQIFFDKPEYKINPEIANINLHDDFFCISMNYKINKVTSQKMIEREMGYRGSKSVKDLNIPTSQIINPLTVKEQRVDGS
ncbi:laglidadg endonuclease (mitochondrion) protein [Rutstroemia sp. NJR-2017a WRK4]|nr:laglidadg endonuclease (mitochondrion) protein [Rutstroemia sp. NJR-2017a WRK4]